jgi:hypothetical protein
LSDFVDASADSDLKRNGKEAKLTSFGEKNPNGKTMMKGQFRKN